MYIYCTCTCMSVAAMCIVPLNFQKKNIINWLKGSELLLVNVCVEMKVCELVYKCHGEHK